MYDKFKTLVQNDGFFYGILIVLVAVSSFGLGRISATELQPKDPQAQIKLIQNASVLESKTAAPAPAAPVQNRGEQSFVASKNGTKYHLLSCPGAKQIKEENKVFFATTEEAEKAGYSKASNCKGI